MPKNFMKGLLAVFSLLFLVGCAATERVSARSYVADKDRVDQDMSATGKNFGYIQGTPVPEDRSKFKKTRKMYILEFTKEAEEPEVDLALPERKKLPPRPIEETPPVVEPEYIQPEPVRVEPPQVREELGTVNYTVENGDTLQKISKKFYNTYRRWNEIFEANQDVLKDPNRVKPGMVLRIPAAEKLEAPSENLK